MPSYNETTIPFHLTPTHSATATCSLTYWATGEEEFDILHFRGPDGPRHSNLLSLIEYFGLTDVEIDEDEVLRSIEREARDRCPSPYASPEDLR